MREKLNITNPASRKVLGLILIVLLSLNFSVVGAQAKICKGGLDCVNCAEMAHLRMPVDMAQMENISCRPGDKNTACGFEAGRIPDDANRIALTVRADQHEFSAIFVAESVIFSQPNPSGGFSLKFDPSEIDGAIPIYLLNESLLC